MEAHEMSASNDRMKTPAAKMGTASSRMGPNG
jgi:hypothetical protein